MSVKVKTSNNQNNQQPTKVIEVGKFYLIHDGSKTGHPGYIIWKDEIQNIFLAIKFGTTPNLKNLKLSHPISTNIKATYVYKKPFLGKRKDFGSKSFNDMFLTKKDINYIMNVVNFGSPIESANIRSLDRRNYRRLCKIKAPYPGAIVLPEGTT